MKKLSWLFVILLLHSGCQQIGMLYMGYKSPKIPDEKGLKKISRKHNIPKERAFYFDQEYISRLMKLDSTKGSRKNHYQPGQALYFFGQKEYADIWFINCRATPVSTGVRWNGNNEFDHFPPEGNIQPDSVLNFKTMASWMKPIYQDTPPPFLHDSLTVVIYYSRFMNRLSKDLIKEVRNNLQKTSIPHSIYYVNTDKYVIPALE